MTERQKLVIITGAPGVGKSTVCKEVFESINGCAWLDSDWCWMVNPWVPKSSEQKTFVEETFSRILRGYLESERISTVLFSWVIHKSWMFDLITVPLADLDIEIHKITLICDSAAHTSRMLGDGRRDELLKVAGLMDDYLNVGASVIDTSKLTIEETGEKIRHRIGRA